MLTAIYSSVGLLLVVIYLGNKRVLPRALARAPESKRRLAARMNNGIAICGAALIVLAVVLLVLGVS
jgi:ABC-type nickel/cobalt efflux system permease component RcnA